jgi:hypothetical protein
MYELEAQLVFAHDETGRSKMLLRTCENRRGSIAYEYGTEIKIVVVY